MVKLCVVSWKDPFLLMRKQTPKRKGPTKALCTEFPQSIWDTLETAALRYTPDSPLESGKVLVVMLIVTLMFVHKCCKGRKSDLFHPALSLAVCVWVCLFVHVCTCLSVCLRVHCMWARSCPTLFDPVKWIKPARLLCPWNSPGKSVGVGGHFYRAASLSRCVSLCADLCMAICARVT